jgi:hypothetical protein
MAISVSMSEELYLCDQRDAKSDPQRHKCDHCHKRWGDRFYDRSWVCAFCWHRLAAGARRG